MGLIESVVGVIAGLYIYDTVKDYLKISITWKGVAINKGEKGKSSSSGPDAFADDELAQLNKEHLSKEHKVKSSINLKK